jgi:hypothetical protein
LKKNNSRLSIYIRTASAFFAFYLVMMIITSLILANNYKDNMTENEQRAVEQLNNIMTQDIYNYYIQYPNNSDISSNEISNLYQSMGAIQSNLEYKHIYIRASLYNGLNELLAKTGNVLLFENYVTDKEGKALNKGVLKSINLDDYMTQDEIIKLISKWHYGTAGTAQIAGYDGKNNVIPKKIDLYNQLFGGTVVSEKVFEPKNISGLELKTYAQGICSAFFEWMDGEARLMNSKTLERYKYCDVIEKPSLDLWLNKGILNSGTTKGNIFECYRSELILNGTKKDIHSYYINCGLVFFPLEVAVNSLIPTYILCFIFVLILIIFLSNRLIKIYEQQQKSENNRRDLTNAIAHELKTPLGIIRNYSEGLKEKIVEDKKDYYLDVIIDETEQMDKMVLEMLDLSKLEANAYKQKLEQFSLKDLVLKKIERYINILEEKQININFICDEDYKIIADITSFEQIISNFLSNAINHTPVGKNIKISIESPKNNVVFSIENQGEHIPQDQMPKIWDSFYKVDNSRERTNGGTGLGLAIAKNYLWLHNAHYGCENTDYGVRFWFSINSSI